MFIVMTSLAAEIVLFLLHEKLLCYHVATEAVAFIVILRLWRIPQTCDSEWSLFDINKRHPNALSYVLKRTRCNKIQFWYHVYAAIG